jgi:hypothetical protein
MAAKLGSSDVSFRLGAGEVAAVYLGSEQVWSAVSVPGAPTITSATDADGTGCGFIEWTVPESDGGSPITAWRFYLNGVFTDEVGAESNPTSASGCTLGTVAGGTLTMSAVTAAGEGPQSAGFTVVLV